MLKSPQFPALSQPMEGGRTKSKRKRSKSSKPTQKTHKQEKESSNAAALAISDIEDFSPEEISEVRSSLLRWYDSSQRTLPWRTAARRGGDQAYAVWVSEVMLQQTQVSTVVKYYNRWMKKWPTVRHLASASIEDVNDLWAGLGYYRRARFLLEGAKSIVEGGEFPTTAADLKKVKGIGEYTAGAIASIAFKEVVPVVDGNVIRVISRLKAISSNPKESVTVKSIWKLAGQLVDPSRPGDFNQALMELGATLCSRSNPGCSSCPIASQCTVLSLSRKFELIKVTDYPKKALQPKKRHDFAAVCFVELIEESNRCALEANNFRKLRANDYKKALLLVKRPEEGLLAGLWEFPSMLVTEGVDQGKRREAVDQYLAKSISLTPSEDFDVILRADVGECVHIFSHIRLVMHVELMILSIKDGVNAVEENLNQELATWKIIHDDSIQSMGLTSGVRKVYSMVQNFKQKTLPFLSINGQL